MNVAGKRCRDFDRDEVVRMVESMLPRFVFRIQPVGTDDG